jgi:hypothetical protein
MIQPDRYFIDSSSKLILTDSSPDFTLGCKKIMVLGKVHRAAEK